MQYLISCSSPWLLHVHAHAHAHVHVHVHVHVYVHVRVHVLVYSMSMSMSFVNCTKIELRIFNCVPFFRGTKVHTWGAAHWQGHRAREVPVGQTPQCHPTRTSQNITYIRRSLKEGQYY
jgi:hypothetical protein